MSTLIFPAREFVDSLSSRKQPLRIEFVAAGMHSKDLPGSHSPEIAIVGRSNVGKSTLINFIAGQKQLARVSRTPGRTQTINLFTVEKGKFYMVDLPGYGYAESPRATRACWQEAMSSFFSERKNLVGVLFLVDARRDVNEDDSILCRWLLSIGLQVLAVQTKCDKVNKGELHSRRQTQAAALKVYPGMIVSTSAQDRTGLSDLLAGLAGMLKRET